MSGDLWRVGRSFGIHVYRGDEPVATFHRAEDAAQAVADRAAVERVTKLHASFDDDGCVTCNVCVEPNGDHAYWPCPTVAALAGAEQEAGTG